MKLFLILRMEESAQYRRLFLQTGKVYQAHKKPIICEKYVSFSRQCCQPLLRSRRYRI